MRPVLQKVRYIYLPFLAAAVGFVAAYSLLTWSLVHRTRLFYVDPRLLLGGLPILFGLVPLLLWVQPRLELLGEAERESRLLFAVAAITMFFAATRTQRVFLGDLESLRWAVFALGAGAALFFLILLLSPPVQRAKLYRFLNAGRRGPLEPGGWQALLESVRRNGGTLTLAAVNVGVFLAMAFSGVGVVGFDGFRAHDLVAWGATSRPLLHGTGLLRLLTSIFVHGGTFHLLTNLYGLYFAGVFLDRAIGGSRVVIAYLVAGACGSVASALVHPVGVTVGASGGVLGLCGLLFGLAATRNPMGREARPLMLVAGIFTGYNLLLGAGTDGVDNAAHVGGVVAGLFLAPMLGRPRTQGPGSARSQAGVG